MSGTGQTFLDPEDAAAGASRLAAAGQTLSSSLSGIAGTINSLNTAAPWGTDDVGKKFNEGYLEGGAEAPAALVLSAGAQIVERVRQLGPDVKSAVEGTVETDDLVAKWFGGEQGK